MRAPALITAALLGSVGLAACSLSGLTFDLGGAGGAGGVAGAASSTASSGGSSAASSSVSTGPAPSVCGNGEKEADEQCDDGNLVALDGCSPACTTDVPEKCPGALVPLTPAGLHIKDTLAGAKQDVKPSCGTDKADLVYAVVPSVSGTLEATGAGGAFQQQLTVSIRSSCADGPTSELACNQGTTASVKLWVHAGVTYWVIVSGQTAQLPFTLDLKLSPCGDGAVTGLEQCDDPANPTCVGCVSCAGNNEVLDPLSRHCYLLQPGAQKSWSGARSNCIAWGGDLVAPSSAAELDFIAKKLSKFVWTGGNALADVCSFSFSNGEPWRAKWISGEPNNADGEDCVTLSPGNGGVMADYPCSASIGYVCERSPAGSCGDGIVQPGEECDDGAAPAPYVTCSGCKLACKAGEIEDPTTHHCYRVVPDLTTAIDAVNACASLEAYLAAINTKEENAWLEPHITAPAWIGLGTTADPTWSNGDPVCYVNALVGDAIKQDCAVIQVGGTWEAASCALKRGYVCERGP
jgi:cysteine-rich repeat protein